MPRNIEFSYKNIEEAFKYNNIKNKSSDYKTDKYINIIINSVY